MSPHLTCDLFQGYVGMNDVVSYLTVQQNDRHPLRTGLTVTPDYFLPLTLASTIHVPIPAVQREEGDAPMTHNTSRRIFEIHTIVVCPMLDILPPMISIASPDLFTPVAGSTA